MPNIVKDLIIILKGGAMGAANVIPGVSGGTVAFLTGIYERLINSIKSFDINAVKLLLKFGARTRMKDSFGNTAITFANEIGNIDLFNLMLLNV